MEDRYFQVQSKINQISSKQRGMPPKLLVVTKQQSQENILPLLNLGHRLFGENQIQEAQRKWPQLKKCYPNIELHLIGHLQTNKVKEAIALFDEIQTLDSIKLADKLVAEQNKQGKFLNYLIEINIGREPQKKGVYPEDSHAFIARIKKDYPLNLIGLMCIPPRNQNPKSYFQSLVQIAKQHHLPEISIGMSSDFPIAIECGSTLIRLGQVFFDHNMQL